MDIFPPLRYFWKTFKRHLLWILLTTTPVTVLIAIGIKNISLEYQSRSTTIFDPRDSAIPSRLGQYPDFSQIGSVFLALKTDTDILDQIAAEASFLIPIFKGIAKPSYQTFLASVLPSEIVPNSWLLDGQFYRQMVIRNIIAESMELQIFPVRYELSLTTKSVNPLDAKLLNELIMNIFVENQMQQYLDLIDANLKTFETYHESEKIKVDGLAELFNLYDKNFGKKTVNLSSKQKKSLKDRERNLITKILSTQAEQEQTLAAEVQRKLALEADLSRLLTQKGPTHPEVMQKSQELRKVRTSQAHSIIKNKLNRQTRSLIELQARMKHANIPIDTSLQLRNLTEESQFFLNRLEQTVKEHKLEVTNIRRQLQNPTSRTRFRFSVPPSFELGLSNKKNIIQIGAIASFLLIGTAIGTVLIREFRSPFYWDGWKYQLAHKQADILAEINGKELTKMAKLSTSQMKELLTEADPKTSRQTMNLQRLRRAFTNFDQQKIKSLYISTMGSAKSFTEIGSLLGRLGGISGNCVLIDLNPLQPVFPSHATRDLLDFLQGKCKWRDVKVKFSTPQPFDLVCARKPLESRFLMKDSFKNLIHTLGNQYDRVIIWGLPGPLFVEHAIAASYVDIWVELLDLTTTHRSALEYPNHIKNHRAILITD